MQPSEVMEELSVWKKAVNKQEARRLLGRNSTLQDEVVKALDNLVDKISPHNEGERNSDTTAVGYLPCTMTQKAEKGCDYFLYLVFKGSKKVGAEQISKHLPATWGRASIIPVTGFEEVGTHAETQILMWLQKNCGFVVSALAGMGLRIACGSKGCCPDCAGYLRDQGIPHTKARDNVAAQWRHPRTEAYFKGTGKGLLYSKHSKYEGYFSASRQNP